MNWIDRVDQIIELSKNLTVLSLIGFNLLKMWDQNLVLMAFNQTNVPLELDATEFQLINVNQDLFENRLTLTD